MPNAPIEITGGAIQDSGGVPLAFGTLTLQLSQDAQANGNLTIGAGHILSIALDANGNVSVMPPQYLWPNDYLVPSTTFYTAKAYTATGLLAWGPNYLPVLSTGGLFPAASTTPMPRQYVISQIALNPTAPGSFTVPTGLGVLPAAVAIDMTSGGQIWFQTVRYDTNTLYLVASDAGVTGYATIWS